MIEAIIEGAVLLYTIVISITSYYKSRKSKKSSAETTATITSQQEKIEALQASVSKAKIIAGIPELINKAEKLFPKVEDLKFGPQRKEYVLQQVKMQCLDAGIDFTGEYEAHIEAVLSTPQKGEENG